MFHSLATSIIFYPIQMRSIPHRIIQNFWHILATRAGSILDAASSSCSSWQLSEWKNKNKKCAPPKQLVESSYTT